MFLSLVHAWAQNYFPRSDTEPPITTLCVTLCTALCQSWPHDSRVSIQEAGTDEGMMYRVVLPEDETMESLLSWKAEEHLFFPSDAY